MIIARSLIEIIHNTNSVVTIGTFDGVHLGHQSIVRNVVETAREKRGRSVVITFDPHPREIVGRGPVKLLSTLDERLRRIENIGVDTTFVVEFTYQFSRMTSREFYERYVIKGIGVGDVVVGHDHMFGRDREAGVDTLLRLGREYEFSTTTVPPITVDGEVVSSSKIREALLRGDVERAARYLGRAYELEGIVVKGDGRGAQLGFPTANMTPMHPQKLVPAEGVYVVKVLMHGQQLYGMLNIGVRPTFHDDLTRVIEVHIFDFHQSVYGEQSTIQFLSRIRQERKFSSKDELIQQLQDDKQRSLKYIETLQSTQYS